MRKNILLILLVTFTFSYKCHAQWTQTNGPKYSGEVINAFAKKGSDIFIGTNGYGVYSSSDNGALWVQKNHVISFLNASTFKDVTALAVSGTNIFAGTYGGGIFSSSNNGDTWIPLNSGLTTVYIYTLAASGNNIIAGTGNGVYTSVNNGNSWQFTLAGNIVSLYNDSTDDILYSACNAYNAGIHISTDHGLSWSYAGLDHQVISVTAKGNLILAGSYDGLYRSTNGGINWDENTNGMSSTFVLSLLISGNTIFAGTSMGLYYSTDDGSNWTRYTSPLVQKTVNSVLQNNGTIFAGTYEYGVAASSDNGFSWDFSNNGLVPLPINSVIAVDQNLSASTGAIYFSNNSGNSWILKKLTYTQGMTFNGGNLYVNTIDDSIFKSTDYGNSWLGFAASRPSVFAVHGNNIFIESIIVDDSHQKTNPEEDKITGVFRSTDFGASYYCVLMVNKVYALAASENEVYTYTSSGAYRTTDDGNNWISIGSGLGSGVRGFYFNGNNIYAASSNGAYRSTDDGATWTQINSGLNNNSVNAFSFSGNYILAATNDGVYSSDNDGEQWVNISPGLPEGTTVLSLTSNSNYLYAGTYDKAVWKLPLEQITGIGKSHSRLPDKFALYQNYPNPFNPTTKIRFDIPLSPLYERGVGRFVHLTIYDILGREVSTLLNRQLQPGTYNIEWNASNYPSGVYFYKLVTDSYTAVKKMILIK
jgi:ligand-binding sensor domain-containing protein